MFFFLSVHVEARFIFFFFFFFLLNIGLILANFSSVPLSCTSGISYDLMQQIMVYNLIISNSSTMPS